LHLPQDAAKVMRPAHDGVVQAAAILASVHLEKATETAPLGEYGQIL